MAVQFLDHFQLLKLELPDIALDFLLPLSPLVRLLLIVDLPCLLHIVFLFINSCLCLRLFLLDRLEELVSIQLLDTLGRLQVVIEALIVRCLGLVLLPVEDLLPHHELLVVLLDLLIERLILRLHLLLENFLRLVSH